MQVAEQPGTKGKRTAVSNPPTASPPALRSFSGGGSPRPTGSLSAVALAKAEQSHSLTVSQSDLSPLESEVIDLFVQLSRLLGQPRSLGEIYGLLFISAKPLVMDDLIQRLQLSKGSASQGLRYLQTLGAVRQVYVPGDRRTHYEAVAELKLLVTRFLSEQVIPHLDSGLRRLEKIQSMIKQMPAAERATVQARVTMLQSWEKKGRRVLPVVTKILSFGK